MHDAAAVNLSRNLREPPGCRGAEAAATRGRASVSHLVSAPPRGGDGGGGIVVGHQRVVSVTLLSLSLSVHSLSLSLSVCTSCLNFLHLVIVFFIFHSSRSQ